VIYRPVATDPNGDPITYGTTIGGPDAGRFVMNSVTREVRFAVAPDFETPADAGGNNVYDISFTATDGTNTTTHNVAVTVSNVAPGFRVRRVASGMTAPIYAAGLPDGSGRVVIVERGGRIRVLNPSTGTFEATDFLNIATQVNTSGERGLLSIAFSPNFLVDRTFYVFFYPLSSNVTEIRKYTTTGSSYAEADAATADTILTIAQGSAGNHKGGTVFFDNAGRLLISLGDGGNTPTLAQDPNSLLGKILRIDPTTDSFPADASRDYAIPASNPFAASGGAPEVYAMGLRNPFRISVDRVTGDLFIGDVGEGAIEEIDRVAAATTGILNFGWNRREGTQPNAGGADDPSFLLPVTQYPHGSGQFSGNSVTGGVVYRGPIEDFQNLYFFGDYITSNVWSLPLTSIAIGGPVFANTSYTNRNAAFAPDIGTIANPSAFGTDNEGNLYIVDISGGEIFRVETN